MCILYSLNISRWFLGLTVKILSLKYLYLHMLHLGLFANPQKIYHNVAGPQKYLKYLGCTVQQ